MRRARGVSAELPVLRAVLAGLTLAAGLMALALVNAHAHPAWVLASGTASAVAAGGTAALFLTVPWSRTRSGAGVDPNSLLPAWTSQLPAAQQEDLADLVTGLTTTIELSSAAAESAESRERVAQGGLWALVGHAATSEERVRGSMVADLHDGVAQLLTVAGYMVTDPDMYSAQELREHIVATETELRDLMTFALPPQLTAGSLGQSLRYLTDTLTARRKLTVEWRWDENAEGPVNEAVALTLYRFFQEALTNVAKHAKTGHAIAALVMDEHPAALRACVRDLGVGFDPQAVGRDDNGHHIGLEMMADRARQLGATLTIESTPGEGTTSTLVIPPPPPHIARTISLGNPND